MIAGLLWMVGVVGGVVMFVVDVVGGGSCVG